MRNPVGKNIVKLRKECGMSQEQLAGQIHVTRQAVSNWETGRSQPDLDTLEALAGVFGTDILVVIYGQQPVKEEADINAADRKRHQRLAVVMGLISLAGFILSVQISGELNELRTRTYQAVPYILFRLLGAPVASIPLGITLMHVLCLFCRARISRPELKKNILILGVGLIVLYVAVILFCWEILPPYIPAPGWMARLSYYTYNTLFPQLLFFIIGILLYLGTEP